MTSFKFIHTADLHLDSPFKGLTKIPDNILQQIRNSTFNAFDQIIEYCIDYKVDFLLISGDSFDLDDKSLKAQIYFIEGLKKLNSHGISTYIIHGNHDPEDKHNQLFNWPDSVHFFSSDKVESLSFFKEDKHVATIYGQSYPTKEFKENIVSSFIVKDKSRFNIGLLHTNVDGNTLHDTYAPSTLSELKNSDIDYWALGHIHKAENLSDSPVINYSGNTQGRHIKETGEKGCLLVEVNATEVIATKVLPTAQIIWEQVEINIGNIESFQDIIILLQEELEKYIHKYNKPIIFYIDLVGRSELYHELQKEVNILDVKEIFNQKYLNNKYWLWIEVINSKVLPNFSLEELFAQNSFVADFFSLINQLKEKELNEQVEDISNQLLANRLMRKHLPTITVQDKESISDEILNLALKYFLEEEIS